jgi:hypothetical protein
MPPALRAAAWNASTSALLLAVYKLALELEPLSAIKPDTSVSANLYVIFNARVNIDTLINGSVFSPSLRSSRESANQMLHVLDNLLNDTNYERQLKLLDTVTISRQYGEFKTALMAELGILPSYFVTQKGGFDTLTLLEGGHLVFSDELQSKVPEAIFDIQQAAKALAYELPTSAGFHIFRATESVLRKYYVHVSGGNPLPKMRNIGVYIQALRRAKCGDDTILSSLEQLVKLHRNPLIHPEAVLTTEEAISTLGMARSVVSAMLTILPSLAPTTANP